MTKLNLKLGNSLSSPVSLPEKDREYFPTIHYEGKTELEIPREGTMTVKYRKVRSSESENEEGEESYSCCLEIQEIVSVEGGAKAPTKQGNETEDALDALAAKIDKLVQTDERTHKEMEK